MGPGERGMAFRAGLRGRGAAGSGGAEGHRAGVEGWEGERLLLLSGGEVWGGMGGGQESAGCRAVGLRQNAWKGLRCFPEAEELQAGRQPICCCALAHAKG